jgi:multimeric flavodoxin WrbA
VPRLLIVHHTPSPALHSLFEAVRDGATNPEVVGVEVVARAALSATAVDVLEADAYALGSPANLGYVSGALKHFFDTIYYPCLEATRNRPFGVYLHGNDDTTGAVRAIEKITTGLAWRPVAKPIEIVGMPSPDDLDRCWDLGATLAATLLLG